MFRGSGETVIDGQSYPWKSGDFLLVPSMARHRHVNAGKEAAILFSLDDSPTLKQLGLFWAQRSSGDTAFVDRG